jgi:glycosyltransferase involved in cell wall biosynthesis
MPQVSVVLPTCNRAGYLERSIGSVLAQTFTDLELIVVDDGSTDNTREVVGAIRDSRLRYERLDSCGGVSRARNHGIRLAQGPWIAFQDSDDQWLPDKLDRQLLLLRDATDIALVVTNTRAAGGYPASRTAPKPDGRVLDVTARTVDWLPPAPTWLAPGAALLAAGLFRADLDCHEDWELGLRLARQGRVLMVNQALVVQSSAPGSLFRNEPARLRCLKKILELHAPAFERAPAARARYCNAVGQLEACRGAMPQARRWFLQALAARPLSPRTWANLLVGILGPGAFRSYVAIARAVSRRPP